MLVCATRPFIVWAIKVPAPPSQQHSGILQGSLVTYSLPCHKDAKERAPRVWAISSSVLTCQMRPFV